MPHIEIEPGVSLFVQDVGAGPPVVLLPPWAHSHEVWDAQVRALAPTHRVVTIDPRGQGRSDRPFGDYSIARHAADAAEVLRLLGLQSPALVGASIGGFVALRLVADGTYPVSRLALVGSNGVKLVADSGFQHGLPAEVMAQFLAAEIADRPRYRYQAAESCLFDPDPATLRWLVADMMQTPSWAALGSMAALIEADQRAELPSVDIPVLLVHGESDQLFNIEASRWVASELKQAMLVTIPSCGHFPHVEAPTAVNDALLSFLQKA